MEQFGGRGEPLYCFDPEPPHALGPAPAPNDLLERLEDWPGPRRWLLVGGFGSG